MGLFHLLKRLNDKGYIDWAPMRLELQRIARIEPGTGSPRELLAVLELDKTLDFCERLYNHLAEDVTFYDQNSEQMQVIRTKSEIQKYIENELQLLFLEENLAFEFSNGLIHRRGRRHAAERVERAGLVLGDLRLSKARAHFNKALKYFRQVAEPDYENAVKEAVCAVEATARALFPDDGKTLGEVVDSITGPDPGQVPKAIAKSFHGLYGFRNGGQGVAHGGTSGGAATKEIAEYSLALTASQIVLLVDLNAVTEPDIPF